MAKKKNKSDAYQYRIIEIAIDPGILSDFSSDESLAAQLERSGYSEEIQELRDQLMGEVRRLIHTRLTERQMQVVLLFLQGKTQIQIGKKLGICQPSVHKALKGNIDYKNGAAKYGGAIKKLQKLCANDEKIQAILERIAEARQTEEDEELP
jgi:DNA-binding CsgD family transcriptional regulator